VEVIYNLFIYNLIGAVAVAVPGVLQ